MSWWWGFVKEALLLQPMERPTYVTDRYGTSGCCEGLAQTMRRVMESDYVHLAREVRFVHSEPEDLGLRWKVFGRVVFREAGDEKTGAEGQPPRRGENVMKEDHHA